MKSARANRFCNAALAFLLTSFFVACGGGSSRGGGGGGGNPPPVPTGLTATPGNLQVGLTWTASAGATGYHVKRSTKSGGPYTQVAAPSVTNDTDKSLTNGTTYYCVVSALNANAESANSSQASATPTQPTTMVNVSVDVLTDRHTISPYVYGVNFPPDAAYITDTNTSLVRWGGNGSSTFNWQLFTYNADNDYYFEDFNFGGLGGTPGDSAQFIKDVKAAGSRPLMTMVMLDWAAQTAENGANGHWSYSVTKYGSQCKVDPFNTDAGNGLKADCTTQLAANPSDAYFPLLDDHTQACPSGNCVYRVDWVTDPTKGLTQAFGGGSCPVPYLPTLTFIPPSRVTTNCATPI